MPLSRIRNAEFHAKAPSQSAPGHVEFARPEDCLPTMGNAPFQGEIE